VKDKSQLEGPGEPLMGGGQIALGESNRIESADVCFAVGCVGAHSAIRNSSLRGGGGGHGARVV